MNTEESYYQAAERNFREKNINVSGFMEIHYASAFIDGCKYIVMRNGLGLNEWEGTIDDTFKHEWERNYNSKLQQETDIYKREIEALKRKIKQLELKS